MSDQPFAPTSNYPRREEQLNKAKAHAKATLAVAAVIELVATLHFIGGASSLFSWLFDIAKMHWIIVAISIVLNLVMMVFVVRYSRHACWSSQRRFDTCVVMVVGSLISIWSAPLGFLMIGIAGIHIYRSLSTDLETYGMTTRGNGVPKYELRQIVNADAFEVTPLG